MRQIEFRGVRKDNGEMVFGNYFHNFRKGESHNIVDFDSNIWYEVIPETVGQYSGLKDKNGVKVFSGDILYCHEYDSSDCVKKITQTFRNAVVGFDKGSFYYYPKGNMNQPHQLLIFAYEPVIIGNVHQHPELLNKS